MRVFLDTVGLLAIWDADDQWHRAASEANARLDPGRADLFSTTFVLAECGNAAARKPYRLAVDRLRLQLESWNTLIVPSGEDWQAAWEAYRRGDAAGAGIVDQLSFTVMRRYGLARAFTNDRHFRAAGFEPLF